MVDAHTLKLLAWHNVVYTFESVYIGELRKQFVANAVEATASLCSLAVASFRVWAATSRHRDFFQFSNFSSFLVVYCDTLCPQPVVVEETTHGQ